MLGSLRFFLRFSAVLSGVLALVLPANGTSCPISFLKPSGTSGFGFNISPLKIAEDADGKRYRTLSEIEVDVNDQQYLSNFINWPSELSVYKNLKEGLVNLEPYDLGDLQNPNSWIIEQSTRAEMN